MTLLGVGFTLECRVELSHKLSLVALEMTPYTMHIKAVSAMNITTEGKGTYVATITGLCVWYSLG